MTPGLAPDLLLLLRKMILIRHFEQALLARSDHGFQLFSSGEEAVAVGVCDALGPQDQLLCSGRSIGPALARGLDSGAVMAELLGKVAGTNRGKGGRGHLAQPALGFLGAHAVVGGTLTIAAGVALGLATEGCSGAVVCIFGDGACGSSALHETLNIAALWRLPLVLVCNNNQMSISTRRSDALAAARLSDLAAPFGVPRLTVDGMDVLAVRTAVAEFVAVARGGGGPAFLECLSERFSPHSTSTRETRSAAELAAIRKRCPIARLAAGLGDETLQELEADVDAEVTAAMDFADKSPFPNLSEALADVW